MTRPAFLFTIAFAAAGIAGAEVSSTATPASTCAADTPLLSFQEGDSPSIVHANNAALRLVPNREKGPRGRSLQIDFDSNAGSSGVVFRPESPWDWSQEGGFSLAFDIVNRGDYSVQLYAELTDENGASQVRAASVPEGGDFETYYIVLNGEELLVNSGMRDNPPAQNLVGRKFTWLWGAESLDLSRIAQVSLYTMTTLHDRKLVIDHVRLTHNTGFDPDYLTGVCDRFGQNAKADFPLKIQSESELKSLARSELAVLADSRPLADRSKFGGWKAGPKLKATGYFRTQKLNGKWALVDPEGYLYFATGLANARMANTTTMTGVDFHQLPVPARDPEDVTPEDSKGLLSANQEARKTRYIASEVRHKMFAWLPDYDDPLAEHYSYKRSVHTGALPRGESFSFYQANLERRYGESSPGSYLNAWRDVTLARMLDWGFTSLGNWADPIFYHADRIPYFANGWIIGNFKTVSSGYDYWSPMPDPFDPEFVRRAQLTAEAIAKEVNGSPWCVGVFVDNEKGWGRKGSIESQYAIVFNTLSRDAAECPTKAAFVRVLRSKYRTIESLNTAWGTSISSWEALAKRAIVSERNEAVRRDFSDLLSAYAEEYFRVVDEALDAAMPNHMYLGVRMAHWGMTPEVVAAAKKYTDVISYNFYKEGVRQADWDFLEEVDMPSIIGEFHMGATSDTGLFHPGLIFAADQDDRARMFKEYMESVIDNPYFVGAHWFQYIDSPLTGRSYDGENYNVGFVTVTDIPYAEMAEAAREMNRELYQRRYGDVKRE